MRGSFLSTGLNWHRDVNDAIMGDKIIIVARKIDKENKPIKGSGKHRAQRAVARHNAQAWVDISVNPSSTFNLADDWETV